ncbi:MAG TPA: hypothetical protein VGD95_02675 [Micavibrio sp.]
MTMKRVTLGVVAVAVMAALWPATLVVAQDNYRYRETDDRMGGSTRAKAEMQRYKDDAEADRSETRKAAPAKPKSTRALDEDAPIPAPEKKPQQDAEVIVEPAATEETSSDAATVDAATVEAPILREAADAPADTNADTNMEAAAAAPANTPANTSAEPAEQIVSRSATPARVPAVLKVNYTALESLGTLHSAHSGSLGIDLWDGSSRHEILQLVNQLPPPRYYGILQRMNQRALLTSADATMMSGRGNIQPGEDFQTIRIEKLLDTGSYLQAAQLYMTDQAVAYHERLARAGVQSLFLSRQPTVACLETKTMMVRFENQTFWNQASVMCDYILGKMAGQVMKDFSERPAVQPIVAESKVMGYVFDKPGYKIIPRSFDELKDYTPLETALMLNDRRINLSKLNLGGLQAAPSHTIGVLMMAADAPGDVKLALWTEAIRRGMITPAELGAFYGDVKLDSKDIQSAKGWTVIPAYYQAMTAARDKDVKKKLAQDALKLAASYPPAALTPFADQLGSLSAEGLGMDAIRRITRVGIYSGVPVSRSLEKALWNQAESGGPNNEDLWLALANAALKNFSTEEMPKKAELQQLTGKLPKSSQSLIFALIEKLDTAGKLHNISAEEAYEKPDGLTDSADYDYVMPSSDLMGNLSVALKDKRLGEVILLSSIAVGEIPPSKMDPGSIAAVVDGLKTVGLTSEARELASEVILGLSKKEIGDY